MGGSVAADLPSAGNGRGPQPSDFRIHADDARRQGAVDPGLTLNRSESVGAPARRWRWSDRNARSRRLDRSNLTLAEDMLDRAEHRVRLRLNRVRPPRPANQGLDARTQFRTGRQNLLEMSFDEIESRIRDELECKYRDFPSHDGRGANNRKFLSCSARAMLGSITQVEQAANARGRRTISKIRQLAPTAGTR